jgi:DNA polymerase/3'-5' exonuclease PolX
LSYLSIQHSSSGSIQHSNNQRLSQAFDELSRLHRKMPLEGQMDEWRAYSFAVVACRLRHLDFEVTASPLVLKQLSQIRYFGKSVMEKVREFLRLGYIQRTKELQKDPKRISMRNMIRIWGVGRAKVCMAYCCSSWML